MSCSSVILIPGPQGSAGAAGADGTDGLNAFTLTTAAFTMPAEGANVTASVVSSEFASVSQIVFVKAGGASGYFSVVTKPTTTTIELQNLENTASGAYVSNSAPATVFASGATVSPAGLQGVAGTTSTGAPVTASYITQTPDATLSSEQALSLLATGMVRNTTATGVLSIGVNGTHYYGPATPVPVTIAEGGTNATTAVAARTNLLAQPVDNFLTSIALLGTAANRIIYTTGVDTAAEATLTSFARNLLDDATPAEARTTLGASDGYGILFSKQSVDLNALGDNAITTGSASWRIDRVTVTNGHDPGTGLSVNLTNARAGLFTAGGGGGTTLVVDAVLSALTTNIKFLDMTLAAVVATDRFTSGTIYYRVGTVQGTAAVADLTIWGWRYD